MWRLSLSGLFVWMAALGAGLATASSAGGGWSNVLSRGIVAAATTLVAVGLVVEAADLRASYRGAAFPSRDAWFGLWLAVVWRAVLSIVLVALLMIELAAQRGLIDLEAPPGFYPYPFFDSATFLWTTHYFGLLIAIWPRAVGARCLPRRANRPVSRHAVAVVTWLMLGAFFAYKMTDVLMITFLVDVAIAGVHQAQPVAYADRAIGPERTRLLNSFVLSSLAACACVSMALLATCAAARRLQRGLSWRIAAYLVIIAGLATAVLCLTWNAQLLGSHLAPEMYRAAFQPWPLLCAIAALLASFLITSAAMRLAARSMVSGAPHPGSATPALANRAGALGLHSDSWWHRRRPTLALLLIGLAISLETVVHDDFYGQRSLWEVLSSSPFVALVGWGRWSRGLLGAVLEVVAALAFFFGEPPRYWTALVGWVCLRGLFRRTHDKYLPAIVPVSPAAFAFAWLALAAVLAVAVPTIFFTTWSLLWSPLFWGRWWS